MDDEALGNYVPVNPELLDRSLTTEELEDQTDPEEIVPEITYQTQDYPVDSLVKRLQSGVFKIPRFNENEASVSTASFQRGFVWSRAQMDRFIESLLSGYPIPGIFLVRQGDKSYLVLDGQQRLTTLSEFYSGTTNGHPFALQHVSERYRGKTYASLDDEERLTLDDTSIPATIITSDGSKEVNNAIYQIFERLNSGGTQLTPHEIRVALYSGALMDSIAALNNNSNWRQIYGDYSKRVRDHELILRIIAMYYDSPQYRRPLKSFLNSFAEDRRRLDVNTDDVGRLFEEAARILNEADLQKIVRQRRSLNVSQTEAIFAACMRAISEQTLAYNTSESLTRLIEDQEFIKFSTYGTTSVEAVAGRLEISYRYLTENIANE